VRHLRRAGGYRSGFESDVAAQLQATGLPVEYEKTKFAYSKPGTKHTYSPDFKVTRPDGHTFFVEVKGLFSKSDRDKHLLVRQSHPDADIRFVFQRSSSPIYKGSLTTYGDWCRKYGFLYSDKRIPDSWLK
jgi:hypothetical protein